MKIKNSPTKNVINHLHKHEGAMYVWFLIFVIFAVTIMSGIITIARLNITISNIKNEIEIASDAVLADYKDVDYSILRDGTTSSSNAYNTTFTKESFANRLADELRNPDKDDSLIICDDNVITQLANSDGTAEEIYKITISDINSSTDGKVTVTFKADITIGIGGILELPYSETYTKTAQLFIKEY